MALILYAVIKFIAYSAWCYLGIRLFDRSKGLGFALLYGGLRLAMGIGIGLLLFEATLDMNNETRNAPLTYAAIYIPTRIVEWAILYFIIRRGRPAFGHVCLWIIGGIVISCLADIPLGIMNGGIVPAGRPFC